MPNEIDNCEREIILFCDDLKNKMLGKYRRGRAEHGSNWKAVDCVKEINEEVLDILNYHCISEAQTMESKNSNLHG